MSILIKGMEMPTNCAACRIGYRDTGWDNKDNECEIVFCPIINQGSRLEDAEAKKHRLCPLVPVPPHGWPVVRGKWNAVKGALHPAETSAVCSNCGFATMIHAQTFYNFCPNCGAGMRET